MLGEPARTILIGAGASADAGIPTARLMARQIYAELRADRDIANAMRTAIGGLRHHRSTAVQDPFGDIDVEDLYEVLRLLSERHTSLMAFFVGSWSHAVSTAEGVDFDAAASMVARSLMNDVSAVDGRGRIESFWHFERALSAALSMTKDSGGTFARAAEQVLKSLVRLSWVQEQNKVQYLVPLLISSKERPLRIASLNYDNAIELAARSAGVSVELGIQEDGSAVSFPDSATVSLAKLHGSVNWRYDIRNGKWATDNHFVHDPLLIFGSGNKLRIDGPYLDLLFSFRKWLEQTQIIEVCGYSFRDPHINYLLLGWMHQDPNRKLSVFDPGMSADHIERNLASVGLPRGVSTYASGVKRCIEHYRLSAAEWISNTQTAGA